MPRQPEKRKLQRLAQKLYARRELGPTKVGSDWQKPQQRA
jgi:hypothetical protein